MKKIIYILRVLVISIEFLMLLIGWLIYSKCGVEIDGFAKAIKVNQKYIEGIMIIPPGIFVWILNEVRLMRVGDKDLTKILVTWPNYWMLKTHTCIQIIYSVIFLFMASIPWLTEYDIHSGIGFILFIIGSVGLGYSGLNIYWAGIHVKEILSFARNR
jgi:hypothetical protein